MKKVVSNQGNEYEILTGFDICDHTLTKKTKRYLNQLMEIDSKVYGSAYVGDISGYISRFGYRKDRGSTIQDGSIGCIDNIIAIAKNDIIIGCINYLTCGKELYEEIIHPDIETYLKDPERRDDGITGEQLIPWTKNKENHLFIISIVILPEYQDTDVIRVLTDEFRRELISKEKEGYIVGSITGDTVSDDGEKALKHMHFNIAQENGNPLILPPPANDETEHVVTVRICEGKNLNNFLKRGC